MRGSDLAEAIMRAVEAGVSQVFTAIPCRVEVYDPATETADLAPCLRRPIATADGEVVHESLPVLPNVPIAFPRGGGVSITWDLAPGDYVIALSTTYSIGQWRAAGGVDVDAKDTRTNHPGSCFGLPLMSPTPVNPSPGSSTIKLGGTDATSPVARGDAVKAWLDALLSAVAPAGGGPIEVVPPVDFPLTSDILATKALVK